MLSQYKESSDALFKLVALRGVLLGTSTEGDPEELVRLSESLLFDSRHGPPGPVLFGVTPPRRHRDGPPDRKSAPPPGPPRGHGFGGPPGAGVPRALLSYTAGLAHYRAGHMDEAIEYLRESAQPDPRNPAQGLAYPVLAMAYHRAGQPNEAHTALTQAEEAFDRLLDAIQEVSVGSPPVPWFDVVEYHLLYREAVELVTGSPMEEDPRLAAFEQRALAALGLP
jgi:tetratricopeptide (TPR) repeat protein